MTQEQEQNCAVCIRRIGELEKLTATLKVAMFDGDNRDRSMKDRMYANEFAISAVKESIDGIARHMKNQSNDKRKLSLVIIGGSLTFFFSSLLLLLTKLLG
jgi:hypothetical protein